MYFEIIDKQAADMSLSESECRVKDPVKFCRHHPLATNAAIKENVHSTKGCVWLRVQFAMVSDILYKLKSVMDVQKDSHRWTFTDRCNEGGDYDSSDDDDDDNSALDTAIGWLIVGLVSLSKVKDEEILKLFLSRKETLKWINSGCWKINWVKWI